MINYFILRSIIIRKILNFFDLFQQKKIIKFFKNNISSEISVFDVGAHHGETIVLFLKNFNIREIHAFEASSQNFKILNEKNFTKINKNIFINNYGISNKVGKGLMNQLIESSSSTICDINTNSNYYKKKISILGVNSNNLIQKIIKISFNTIDKYYLENNFKKIDILKIDTEGHEYEVLLGAKDSIKNFQFIYFEHHYDNMIKKNYKFHDIHKYLLKNNFKNVFKVKMIFRKSFEYIYQNQIK
tara:strand:- start:3653 stop:4384 length:732 start_codon:yes stop_codon:yes gene_type:complete